LQSGLIVSARQAIDGIRGQAILAPTLTLHLDDRQVAALDGLLDGADGEAR
jgi:hypothetical protein